jgi:hypothetical protein
MMISRRPNTRASTENAPGPSPRIATSIVNPKMTEIFESKRSWGQAGSIENLTPAAPAATSHATSGVMKPTRSRTPAAMVNIPINDVADEESDPLK